MATATQTPVQGPVQSAAPPSPYATTKKTWSLLTATQQGVANDKATKHGYTQTEIQNQLTFIYGFNGFLSGMLYPQQISN